MKVDFWALISEKGGVSLGRVSYWIVLAVACYMWVSNIIVQESLLLMLMSLLSYNLGKKSLDVFAVWAESKKQPANKEQGSTPTPDA
jgi:hypothetical protein